MVNWSFQNILEMFTDTSAPTRSQPVVSISIGFVDENERKKSETRGVRKRGHVDNKQQLKPETAHSDALINNVDDCGTQS
jgi:hypothetical protein